MIPVALQYGAREADGTTCLLSLGRVAGGGRLSDTEQGLQDYTRWDFGVRALTMMGSYRRGQAEREALIL